MDKNNKAHKNKYIKRTVLALMIICLVPFVGSSVFRADKAAVDEAQKRLEELKNDQKEIENKINGLNTEYADVQDRIAELDDMAAELNYSIYCYNLQISDCQGRIDSKINDISLLTQQIDALKEKIELTKVNLQISQQNEADQYEAMKLRIQYMYENGDNTFMDLIFESKDMEELLNKAEYIAEISEYDRNKFDEYVETKETVAALLVSLEEDEASLEQTQTEYQTQLASLESEKATLEEYKSEQQVEKESCDTVLAAKNDQLNGIENSLSSENEKLKLAQQEVADQEAIYQQAKREYEAWLAELAKQNQNASEAVAAKLAEIGISGFTWPAPGYTYITSPFGMRLHPILGTMKLHDGIDIAGSGINGTPIKAAYSGTVILSEVYWGYGNCVKIDHGGGIQTLYAHASKLLVSVGQYVNAGDTIALVGSTGNSTGPHLHLSLLIAGEFVNPLDYFTPR